MALTQTYCDYAAGNDYKGATFIDGAYTSATKTLIKTNAFAANKVNHWLWLESNDGGSIVAGYYKIATWTDASTVILATDAGAGVDDDAAKCTQHDGTILLPYRSVQGALDLTTRDATNGDQINVKAGTAQTLAATIVLTTYGTPTAAAPLVIRGYTSAANDGGIGDLDGAASYSIISAPSYTTLIDLRLHNVGGRAVVTLAALSAMVYCEIDTNTGANYAISANSNSTIANCYVHDTDYGANAKQIVGCYFVLRSGGNRCINLTQGGHAVGNVIVNNATGGIGIACADSGMAIIGNTFYSSVASTASAITQAGGIPSTAIINNIIVGWSGTGGEGINFDSTNCGIYAGNAFYNNTTATTAATKVITDINNDALAASPFVNAATGDFDINGTIAGVTEDGYPSAFHTLPNTTPKMDKGAVQAGAGTGGSGAVRILPYLAGVG